MRRSIRPINARSTGLPTGSARDSFTPAIPIAAQYRLFTSWRDPMSSTMARQVTPRDAARHSASATRPPLPSGSQNCADPEFRIKAKYAPWVDVMLRVEGPVARQNQHLFASDWMTYAEEDITDLLLEPLPPVEPGFPAQVVPGGPTVRHSAMPEMFQSLMYAARRELVVTTPYYVPDESMQAALCAAAFRGVATTIVFPARNDNFLVAAASRSYYAELLAAGVRILEFPDGLLHAKTVTVDGEVTLVGSANMDRRSFDLNYENNLLLWDEVTTAAVRARQDAFIARSSEVRRADVEAWSMPRRLWNNAAAVVGPVL